MPVTAPGLDEILPPGFLLTLFQPIVRVMGEGRFEVESVEALVRGPSGSLFEPAPVLCDFVRRKNAEVDFDRSCVLSALTQARALPAEIGISLNVHAVTLHRDQGFHGFLGETAKRSGIPLSRLTVEIIEHAPDWADYRLGRTLDQMRQDGIRISLDDIGLGQSSFRMILDARPDRFKVDRYFVHGCAHDPHRRAVLDAIRGLAQAFGASVVAEGVELENDFSAAHSLGIDRFQGHLFCPALPAGEIGGIMASPGGRTHFGGTAAPALAETR